ncbi:MAG: hypothetical protein Q8Q52_03595, partial [Acidimicrobiia bacterium]|nr:hypothetical protein [Acidimicrobiia bacterium]
ILVLSIAPVFEHHNFARRAAAEAARTLVLTPDNAEEAAVAVVTALARGHNVDPAMVVVRFCGGGGCGLERGSLVSVEVEVTVPQVSAFLPIGNQTVTATHAEQVDPYRSRPRTTSVARRRSGSSGWRCVC